MGPSVFVSHKLNSIRYRRYYYTVEQFLTMGYGSNKEFMKEFSKIQSCENLEIQYVLVGDFFLGGTIMAEEKFNNTTREKYTKGVMKNGEETRLMGYWCGISLLKTPTLPDDDYEIVYEKTYEICRCCFNEKFYNENKDEWYCPSCLENRPWHYKLSEWKRKAISYLPERVKQ